MQRPSTGELLGGLRRVLDTEVLATLLDGAGRRQLKAALHLIGRLERTWDLAGAHLAADNADIEATLAAFLPEEDGLAERLERAGAGPEPGGYNDPALRSLAARNLALHLVLLDLPDNPELHALRQRMAARDCRLVGETNMTQDTGR